MFVFKSVCMLLSISYLGVYMISILQLLKKKWIALQENLTEVGRDPT